MKRCKDCVAEGVTTNRPLAKVKGKLVPGPRCVTHHRLAKKAASARNHGRQIESKYGITAEDYAALLAYQGGKCFICERARGVRRRLAVDHNHVTGEVRGLLCSKCNQMLGEARDNPEFFRRAAHYLGNPPFDELKKLRDNL